MKLSKLEISVNGTGRNEIDGLLVSALSIQPYSYAIRFLSYSLHIKNVISLLG